MSLFKVTALLVGFGVAWSTSREHSTRAAEPEMSEAHLTIGNQQQPWFALHSICPRHPPVPPVPPPVPPVPPVPGQTPGFLLLGGYRNSGNIRPVLILWDGNIDSSPNGQIFDGGDPTAQPLGTDHVIFAASSFYRDGYIPSKLLRVPGGYAMCGSCNSETGDGHNIAFVHYFDEADLQSHRDRVFPLQHKVDFSIKSGGTDMTAEARALQLIQVQGNDFLQVIGTFDQSERPFQRNVSLATLAAPFVPTPPGVVTVDPHAILPEELPSNPMLSAKIIQIADAQGPAVIGRAFIETTLPTAYSRMVGCVASISDGTGSPHRDGSLNLISPGAGLEFHGADHSAQYASLIVGQADRVRPPPPQSGPPNPPIGHADTIGVIYERDGSNATLERRVAYKDFTTVLIGIDVDESSGSQVCRAIGEILPVNSSSPQGLLVKFNR
jgi:hypothetical protein